MLSSNPFLANTAVWQCYMMGKAYNYQLIGQVYLSLEMKRTGGYQAVMLARQWLNANVS